MSESSILKNDTDPYVAQGLTNVQLEEFLRLLPGAADEFLARYTPFENHGYGENVAYRSLGVLFFADVTIYLRSLNGEYIWDVESNNDDSGLPL